MTDTLPAALGPDLLSVFKGPVASESRRDVKLVLRTHRVSVNEIQVRVGVYLLGERVEVQARIQEGDLRARPDPRDELAWKIADAVRQGIREVLK